jgi:hypothetical protein
MTRPPAPVLGVVVLLASSAACGRAADDNVAPPPTASATAPALTTAPSVALVPHETLLALVPDLAGWTRGATTSAAVALPAPASHAVAAYTRGQARIDFEITDTGGHPDYVGSLAKIAGTSFAQKASNGYMKGTTLAGHPAVESWNHVDRLGDISLLVDRRFVIHATGTGLDGIETLRTLVEKVKIPDVK